MKHLYTFSLAVEKASASPLASLEISPDATTGCITADGDLVAVGKAVGSLACTRLRELSLALTVNAQTIGLKGTRKSCFI